MASSLKVKKPITDASKNENSIVIKKKFHPKDYETKLSTEEEKGFHPWLDEQHKKGHIAKGDYKYYKENNHGYDYDFRAAYKYKANSGLNKNDNKIHWGDIGKKPNHPTFSNESVHYPKNAKPGVGGRWEGDNYIENPKVGPPVPPTKEALKTSQQK